MTDAIHATRCIFDSSSHLYQLHSITVSQDLRVFFNKSSNNSIAFWDCPSSIKWLPYSAVDKETKWLNIDFIFPCKLSWDFSKNEECNLNPLTWKVVLGSNILDTPCVQVTRAITNHAPIGEYHLRFFLREPFECPCRVYPIESRHHILHNCRRYNKYWDSNREGVFEELCHFPWI